MSIIAIGKGLLEVAKGAAEGDLLKAGKGVLRTALGAAGTALKFVDYDSGKSVSDTAEEIPDDD